MTPIKRITCKKIQNPHYSHALCYQGCSNTPMAYLFKTMMGWVLVDANGNKRGVYDSIARARLRASEFGLL